MSAILPALLHDLRYGFRTLRRTPGFTAVAVVVLALGIGVNATVFSVANAFFFRPLPVTDPDTVVRVYSNRFSNTLPATYQQLRDRNTTLSGLAGFTLRSFSLTIDAEPEHAFGEIVTGNYFPVVAVPATQGRLLGPSDDVAGAPPAVVLSHAFWVRRFGALPDAVGRTVTLNGVPFTIVGIAGRGFTGVLAPLAGDLWVPMATDSQLRPALDPAARLQGSMHLVGRLKAGADRAQAQADLDTIGRQVRASTGQPVGEQAVTVYGATMLHPEASAPLTAFTAVLMTVVALVLLIVCVNVANLVLARAAGRAVELAVRQSLGAGRGRLIRQLLTENLLLSLAGAAGGFAIAWWSTRLLMASRLPVPVPVALDLSVDVRVLAFTIVAAIAATLAFGMVPALTASRVDLVPALKGSGGGRPRQGRLRSAFLIAQVSMSILLLITAGLFVRSFRNAQNLDAGFEPEGVLTASIDVETRGYPQARALEVYRSVVERLEARAGIQSANLVDIVPLTLSNTTAYLLRDGDAPPAGGERPPTPQVYVNAVGPGHFRTLQIPTVAGRDFTYQDDESATQVAIVNETLARQFWPGKPAVGQRLRSLDASHRTVLEVIAVVRDSKYVTVGEPSRPFLYRPVAQQYTPRVTILVRSTEGTAATIAAMKQEVRVLDPGLSLFNVETLVDATSISLLPARVAGALLGALGFLALALAAIGIYGVLSFLVRSRTPEIGLRIAIGATPRNVAAMVVRQAMTWTFAGAAIGVGLAFALTRFLKTFLYGISPTDPWTYATVTMALVLVACAAAVAPAVRASRMDPLAALRTQ
jgi:macrolide transport system ATP-binding/permease protein